MHDCDNGKLEMEETNRGKGLSASLTTEKGQSLVEFALVVPLLLILVFGIAEFGRAWMTRNILTGAAREAVRVLAVPAPAGGISAATTRANQVLTSAGITTATVSPVDPGTAFGAVTVTINYNFPVVVVGFIPGLNSSTIPLSSTTTMRREY
jgi:Flp pilus assembly protein TadG